VHTRYVTDFGLAVLTPTRPRMRPYLWDMTSSLDLDSCRAAELFMHMRLETLPLNAFHRHTRPRETTAARTRREMCPACSTHAETPTHFLLECPAYSSLRSLPCVAACIAGVQAQQPQTPWRALLDEPTMAPYIYAAWTHRRAALTGREANGASPMALTPAPEADVT
jgi:hypothetical protein